MASLSCHCFNVNIQIVSPPVQTTDQRWLADQIGATKVGEAKVKSGPLMEVESLVTMRMVSGWKVYKCCNCNIDVCAIDGNNVSRAIVNMELEGRNVDPHVIAVSGKRFYSPCFRIVIEEDTPDLLGVTKDNLQAIDTFNKLQRQVDTFISAEERTMEKRIRAYIKEQQEVFNIVKSRANKDRAILWRRLCKINASYGSTQNISIASHSASSSPFKIAYSAPSSIAPISNTIYSCAHTTTPPKVQEKVATSTASTTDKGWQSADRVSQLLPRALKTSSADGGVFSFDDDDQDDSDSGSYVAPLQLAAQHSPYQEVPSDDEEDTDTQPTDSAKYLATSLPVHIWNPMANAGVSSRTNTNRDYTARSLQPVEVEVNIPKVPQESWSSRSDHLDEELPEEVAASFAVPLSLNRRIKSLI